jgi:hypothetical protein
MQRIEDVKEPQVGKYYLVPCAPVHHSVWSRLGKWLPVIGPWHEDADINVPVHHFHYDCRFIPARLYERSSYPYIGKLHTWHTSHDLPAALLTPKAIPLEYKRRKMLRPMPEFPTGAPFHDQLEKQFENVKLKCRTCPHRGMSLDGLPVASDGTVVCNGHGLKWNLKTGELVKR